jgi:hypothetical protein
LNGGADEYKPAGADELATLESNQMQRAVVTTVALLGCRHALLDAEDLMAQRQRRIELVLSPQAPNLEVDGAVGPARFHPDSLPYPYARGRFCTTLLGFPSSVRVSA